MTTIEDTKSVPATRCWADTIKMGIGILFFVFGGGVMLFGSYAIISNVIRHWSRISGDISGVIADVSSYISRLTGDITSTLVDISNQPLTVGSTILIGLAFLFVLNLWRTR